MLYFDFIFLSGRNINILKLIIKIKIIKIIIKIKDWNKICEDIKDDPVENDLWD